MNRFRERARELLFGVVESVGDHDTGPWHIPPSAIESALLAVWNEAVDACADGLKKTAEDYDIPSVALHRILALKETPR